MQLKKTIVSQNLLLNYKHIKNLLTGVNISTPAIAYVTLSSRRNPRVSNSIERRENLYLVLSHKYERNDGKRQQVSYPNKNIA